MAKASEGRRQGPAGCHVSDRTDSAGRPDRARPRHTGDPRDVATRELGPYRHPGGAEDMRTSAARMPDDLVPGNGRHGCSTAAARAPYRAEMGPRGPGGPTTSAYARPPPVTAATGDSGTAVGGVLRDGRRGGGAGGSPPGHGTDCATRRESGAFARCRPGPLRAAWRARERSHTRSAVRPRPSPRNATARKHHRCAEPRAVPLCKPLGKTTAVQASSPLEPICHDAAGPCPSCWPSC